VPREVSDPKQFQPLVDEVAPGFRIAKAGKSGIAIVADHAGRPGVLRAQAPSAQEPVVLRGTVDLAPAKRSRLAMAVSSAASARWNLKVNADGRTLHQQVVGGSDAPAWQTVSVDLSSLAGRKITLELLQSTVDGNPVAAYWGQVEVISD
jgi:hypothetical protein